MKGVVISDLHIGSPRVKDFWIEALWRAFDEANKLDKTVIVPGDWLEAGSVAEPRLLNKVFCELNSCFNTYGLVQLISILGNHDIPIANHTTNEDEIELNSPMMLMELQLPRLVCAAKPRVIVIGAEEIPVVLLPYRPVPVLRSQIKEVFEKYNYLLSGKKKVLVTHTSFQGQMLPSGKEEDRGLPMEDIKDFDLVIAGHIHSYSTIGKIVVAGAPYQMKFGDTHGVLSIVEL